MKRRRQRINKYTLTEADTFKERLRRSNPSPLERIAKMAEIFNNRKVINPADIYEKQRIDMDLFDDKEFIDGQKILEMIRSDNDEDRTEG